MVSLTKFISVTLTSIILCHFNLSACYLRCTLLNCYFNKIFFAVYASKIKYLLYYPLDIPCEVYLIVYLHWNGIEYSLLLDSSNFTIRTSIYCALSYGDMFLINIYLCMYMYLCIYNNSYIRS